MSTDEASRAWTAKLCSFPLNSPLRLWEETKQWCLNWQERTVLVKAEKLKKKKTH